MSVGLRMRDGAGRAVRCRVTLTFTYIYVINTRRDEALPAVRVCSFFLDYIVFFFFSGAYFRPLLADPGIIECARE